MKALSIKIQLALFLFLFAAYLFIAGGYGGIILNCLIAAAFAFVFDCAFAYIKTRKLVISDSSLVSGLIIGIVLAGDRPWWVFLAASLSAILSKHLLRFKKRHLFNPAAFGILSAISIFGSSARWGGADLWYILVPAGLYFVYKIRKLEIVYSYIALSLALFGGQAIIQKTSLVDPIMYQNWFFIFVMLIEPKTTPVTKIGKAAFGGLAALQVFLLTRAGVTFDAELSSLLFLNLLVPALNRLPAGSHLSKKNLT